MGVELNEDWSGTKNKTIINVAIHYSQRSEQSTNLCIPPGYTILSEIAP